MDFTKREFTAFMTDLERALAPIEEKYKLKIHHGNISYDALSFSIRLNAEKTEQDGVPVDKTKEDFMSCCYAHRLRPEDYGAKCKVISEPDTVYIITGINPRARVNDIIIKRESDGKQFVCKRQLLLLEGENAPLSGFRLTVEGKDNTADTITLK